MDFEARRLRVQLPCGTQTLIACVWGTCRLPSVLTCLYRTPFCWNYGSWCRTAISECTIFRTRVCEIGTRPTWPPDCGTTIWERGDIFEQIVSPVLEVEDLDILREQLEGQLKEVISAQEQIAKASKKRG